MIAKILLTGLMTLFLSGSIVTITEDCDETKAATENIVEDISKAIEFNGEIIPLVELPTVEIIGQRNTDDLVKAIIVDGRAYPSFELEEVVITPGA